MSTDPKVFSAYQAGRDRRVKIRKMMFDKGFSYAVAERVVDGLWTDEEAERHGLPQEAVQGGNSSGSDSGDEPVVERADPEARGSTSGEAENGSGSNRGDGS